mmetsp:Transcript_6378/g.13060  ORF Transcript_6378/g.13060 Transcript_6378/m.13060 type:complete len:94 (+) Transcript_6378:1753-2034(+)
MIVVDKDDDDWICIVKNKSSPGEKKISTCASVPSRWSSAVARPFHAFALEITIAPPPTTNTIERRKRRAIALGSTTYSVTTAQRFKCRNAINE